MINDAITGAVKPKNIWEYTTMHDELDLIHAENSTIAYCALKSDVRSRKVGAINSNLGDGAPFMKNGAFVRRILSKLMNVKVSDDDLLAALEEGNDESHEEDNGASTAFSAAEKQFKELSPAFMKAMLESYNLLGIFHAFGDLLKRCTMMCETTILALAPTSNGGWRNTWKKVLYLITCGDLNRCYLEMMSIFVGIQKHFLDEFRAADKYPTGTRTTDQVHLFVQQWADVAPVIASLELVTIVVPFVYALRSAMRAGNLEACLLVLDQHIEIAGAKGGDKYLRMLQEFKVLVRTVPDRVLVLLESAMFTDFGSHFKPSDEHMEDCHRCMKAVVLMFRNPDAWFAQMRKESVMLPYNRLMSNAGLYTGKGRLAIGAVDILAPIAVKVVKILRNAGLCRSSTVWRDTKQKEHAMTDWFALNGTKVTVNYFRQQDYGRAIGIVDARDITIFAIGLKNWLVKRPPLRRINTTVDAEIAAQESVSERRDAKSVPGIAKLLTKPGMQRVIGPYVAHVSGSTAPDAVFDDDKVPHRDAEGRAIAPKALIDAVARDDKEYIPRKSHDKTKHVYALHRWRQFATWYTGIEFELGAKENADDVILSVLNDESMVPSLRKRFKLARESNFAAHMSTPLLPARRQSRTASTVADRGLPMAEARRKLLALSKVNVPHGTTDPAVWLKSQKVYAFEKAPLKRDARKANAEAVARVEFEDEAESRFSTLVTSFAFREMEEHSYVPRTEAMDRERARHHQAPSRLLAQREKIRTMARRLPRRNDDILPPSCAPGLCVEAIAQRRQGASLGVAPDLDSAVLTTGAPAPPAPQAPPITFAHRMPSSDPLPDDPPPQDHHADTDTPMTEHSAAPAPPGAVGAAATSPLEPPTEAVRSRGADASARYRDHQHAEATKTKVRTYLESIGKLHSSSRSRGQLDDSETKHLISLLGPRYATSIDDPAGESAFEARKAAFDALLLAVRKDAIEARRRPQDPIVTPPAPETRTGQILVRLVVPASSATQRP